jgi:hypothetical protein
MIAFSFDGAYITWINNGIPAWTIMSAGMGPDTQTEISARPVPQEPMVRFFRACVYRQLHTVVDFVIYSISLLISASPTILG